MNHDFEADRFLVKLTDFDALRQGDTIKTGVLDRIEPSYAQEWSVQLNPKVRDAMVAAGISVPSRHQADAIGLALTGDDVVIESPTAKGMDIARNCSCSTGCQNCIEPAKSWDISNANIDKKQGILLAEKLLEETRNGPDRKLQNGLLQLL